MRIPRTPPSSALLLSRSTSEMWGLLNAGIEPTYRGRYVHWDKLRHLPLPDKAKTIDHETWWAAIKVARMPFQKPLPLTDLHNRSFVFGMPDPVPEKLHFLDQRAGATLATQEPTISRSLQDQYLVRSLTEEAITSSQLEGAVTTREVAKQMLRSGRAPRDVSERMIYNNYRAMQRIRELKGTPLTVDTLFELHRILTAGTLDNEDAVGRFRTSAERVVVADNYDEVIHTPPAADLLQARITLMCDFANRKQPAFFIHPIIRAIVLHFWLAYDHPFVDGNGRCARALFYWCMLNEGYWLSEYISISHVVRKAPIRYGRAFLYTETDDNDLNYFILYHLDVLCQAFHDLHTYIDRKAAELRRVESIVRNSDRFNHRQLALLAHALRHPDARYTVQEHQRDHNVVYETARMDLTNLMENGLLERRQRGREYYFLPVKNLSELFNH